jgi:hypothetical protein
MSDWGKIAIATRMGKHPEPVFVQCLVKLIQRGQRAGDVVLKPAIGSERHYLAEAQAQVFLQTKADSILYLDDDMEFEPKDLAILRDDPEGFQYDILMGLCLSRGHPHRPIIATATDHGTWRIPAKPPEDTIVDVGFCGLAFTLIRRSVFEKVYEILDKGEMAFWFSRMGDSEDWGFCQTAIKAGCRIGVNTRVQIYHLIDCAVGWDFKENGVNYQERIPVRSLFHQNA